MYKKYNESINKFFSGLPMVVGLYFLSQFPIWIVEYVNTSKKIIYAQEWVGITFFLVITILYFIYWATINHFVSWNLNTIFINKMIILIGFLSLIFESFIFGNITLYLHVDNSINEQIVNNIQRHTPFILFFLLSCIGAPIMEEIIFRASIFKLFSERSFIAPLFSAICFTVSHLFYELTNFIGWIPYLFLGLVFSYIYKKTKSLEATIFLHFIWNLVGLLI